MLAVVAVLATAACAPVAPVAPVAPAASETASASAPGPAASASATTPSQEPSANATQTALAVPSGPCVDVGDLADLGEPVVTAMTAIKPALDAKKIDDARALAQTATDGLAAMAELVGTASPQAKKLFTTAASEMRKARSEFPSGVSLLDQARDDLDQAFAVAQTARCAG